MKLKNKITLIVIFLSLLMFGITYFGSERVLKEAFIKLENQQAFDDVNRGVETLEHVIETLNIMSSSYGIWDDTYNYMENPENSKYPLQWKTESFASSDMTALFFYNKAGKQFFGMAVNDDKTEQIPIPEGYSDYLKPDGKLVHQPNVDSNITGLISIPSGLYIVVAHSIVKSDNTGPSNGAVIISKHITGDVIKEVEDSSKVNLMILPLEEAKKESDISQVYEKIIAEDTPVLEKREEVIYGYTVLRDIEGSPIAIMKATLPRTILAVGDQAINYFTIAQLLSGLAFIISLLYLLSNLITNRLEKLNTQILHITETKQFSKKINEQGKWKDEIYSLEKETNQTLSIIDAHNKKQKKILDLIVNEESFLNTIIDVMPSALVITDDALKIKISNQLAGSNSELNEKLSEHSLIEVFPYLKEHEAKLHEALKINHPQVIEKIYSNKKGGVYYNTKIYPIIHENKKSLLVRIDDITDSIKLNEKIEQSHKLASIGVLTAGVAHEINNPINFVSSAISPLKNNISDLVNLLNKYSDLQANEKLEGELKEIDKLEEEMDLEATIQETDELIDSILHGSGRTNAIINDLKNFTTKTMEAKTKQNLQNLLDSAVDALTPKLGNNIEVIKNYQPIPEVECFPNHIKQAFSNILINAIEAISGKGEIRIKTAIEKNNIAIHIRDTGKGISEENKQKIFDPFYTTKEVGAGTGMGLTSAFAMIRDLGGIIEIQSQLEKGSEFTILIPVNIESLNK